MHCVCCHDLNGFLTVRPLRVLHSRNEKVGLRSGSHHLLGVMTVKILTLFPSAKVSMYLQEEKKQNNAAKTRRLPECFKRRSDVIGHVLLCGIPAS